MDPGFLADPDPNSEKKTYTDPDPGKNADPKHYKKRFSTGTMKILKFNKNAHFPCIMCLYYLTITFL